MYIPRCSFPASLLIRLTGSLRACLFFFYKDTPTPEIYPLSLHDALPILASSSRRRSGQKMDVGALRRQRRLGRYLSAYDLHGRQPPLLGLSRRLPGNEMGGKIAPKPDRKSTRLNSSHT